MNEDNTHKSIIIERYKTISDKTFLDGFTLEAGSEVRRIIESEEESESLNVIYESSDDVKRIFWIKKDNLELASSQKELINNHEYEIEIRDKNESWFN